jgi:hypothetical protein
MELWNRISVSLGIKNRIVGGTPTDPKLIQAWISANMPAVDEAERKKLADATVKDVAKATEEKAEGMWTTFKRDDTGVYIEGRQIKAAFKESSNILRDLLIKAEGRKDGTKSRYTNLKAKLAERLFVEEDKIYFTRKGVTITKPDGNEERAIHVMTAQGPRTALKRCDFVGTPCKLQFTLRYLADGVVDLDLIKTLLEHSSWNGIGADRSQGNGLFEVLEVQPL